MSDTPKKDARLALDRVREIAGRKSRDFLAQPMMPKVIMTAESAALAAEVLALRAVADAVRAWADLGDRFHALVDAGDDADPGMDRAMAVGDQCQEAAAKIHETMAAYDGTPTRRTRTLLVSPRMAARLLEHTDAAPDFHLRNRNPRLVAHFAAAMRAGDWILNGDPVLLTQRGHVMDGQHRLAAVVEFDQPVRMLVVFGATTEDLTGAPA